MFKEMAMDEMMEVNGGGIMSVTKASIPGIVVGIVLNEVSRQVTGKSMDDHVHDGVEALKKRAIETSQTMPYTNNHYGYPTGTMK